MTMKHFLTILLLFQTLLIAAQSQNPKSAETRFKEAAALKSASYSVCFAPTSTGNPIWSLHAQTKVVPASVFKLVTTATALEQLGPNFKFETQLLMQGSLENGTLNGNLLVKGGGDPTLGSAHFNANTNRSDFLKVWSEEVKKAGIERITGNIIIDRSVYDDQEIPQTWIWEDMGNHYGAAAQGISVFDNVFELIFETENSDGGATQIVGSEPEIPNLLVENQVTASNSTRDRAYIFGSPYDTYRVARGTLPKGQSKFRVKASIPNPAQVLGNELSKALISNQIELNGTVKVEKIDSSFVPLKLVLTHYSPTLSEIVRKINVHSMNLFAEHLCKQLGLYNSKTGNTTAGCAATEQYWSKRLNQTSPFFAADGSGLSRANALSAQTICEILAHMKTRTNGRTFSESLPLAGVEGTMANYFTQSVVKGKIRVKSGSMTRVRSLAGYMTTAKGTELCFAIIVNNFTGAPSATIIEMERLVEWAYNNL
jgi:serine-type D-Ala-D-Ala carboxypeptidase/endopeptidase (penicillin-binding protein 4)